MKESSKTPAARIRRSKDIRVAIVSGLFVLLGIAVRDRVPWYATAFFAVCLVVAVLSALGLIPEPKPDDRLTIDDVGITRTARKVREHVAWADIARVRIITTDEGPYIEDVFFVLDSVKGDGCVITQDLAVRGQLLEALQARLEGLDNGAVIDAMTSATNRTFTIWEKKDSVTEPGVADDSQ